MKSFCSISKGLNMIHLFGAAGEQEMNFQFGTQKWRWRGKETGSWDIKRCGRISLTGDIFSIFMEFTKGKKAFVFATLVTLPLTLDESLNAAVSLYISHSPTKQIPTSSKGGCANKTQESLGLCNQWSHQRYIIFHLQKSLIHQISPSLVHSF